ncbi:MAG: sigma-54 dependent transcriptional regulator, partial [candidate division NC10 bacterium]
LIAQAVHQASPRARGPFVAVHCAARSEGLLESELFGHERGSFTGATERRVGRFESADGGTLFLDEIGDFSLATQVKLLRVLQDRQFERVGANQTRKVNVRILCTSNRDLAQEVEKGRFRRDLYYRISGIHLTVPALRERPEDIPVLVWHFVNQYAAEVRRTITDLDPAMLDALERCPWPGNVRQLRNVVRSALILGSGPVLSLENVAGSVCSMAAGGGPAASFAAVAVTAGISACDLGDSGIPALDSSRAHGRGRESGTVLPGQGLRLVDLERQAILEAMRRTQSHQAKAARLLGITDRTLREKLRRYRQAAQTPIAEAALTSTGDKQWLTQPR